MLIEVPDDLADGVLQEINYTIAREKSRQESISLYATDDGLNKSITDGDFRDFNGMIGRLGDYVDYEDRHLIPRRRVFNDYRALRDKCPVVMAGSRYELHRKYSKGRCGGSNANGWHEHVAERYIRMLKHTSVGWDLERESLYKTINDWAGSGSWGKFENPMAVGPDVAYINGNRVWIKDDNMLRSLKSLIKQLRKIENVEKCLERLQEKL